MYQMYTACITLTLLLLLVLSSSATSSWVYNSLSNPTCYNRPLQTTINQLQEQLTRGPPRRYISYDMRCTSSIFGCDPNIRRVLRRKCGEERVADYQINLVALCKWTHSIKWSKMRQPQSIIQAVLSDSSQCVRSSGTCQPITHSISVMAIRNQNRRGPCMYSYRKEHINIGFRCVKSVS